MIVVTGATGFIGSATVWELNQAGRRDILAVDYISPEERPGQLTHLAITDFLEADAFLDQVESDDASLRRVSAIFHIGACATTTETNREYLERVNIQYSQKLFRYCTEQKIPFVYASSAATYGASTDFSEDQDLNALKPLNLYGWSKLEFDKWVLQQKATPPRWFGFRYFNVYGPNEYHKGDMASVVFKAFHQIRDTGKLKLFKSYRPEFKDGHQQRDFVYVKDVTRWMWETLNNHCQNGIYNMGSGTASTWLQLAEAVFSSLQKKVNIEWIEMPDAIRNQYQYFTQADMTKFKRQGAGSAQWSLEKGIADYVGKHLLQDDPFLKLKI